MATHLSPTDPHEYISEMVTFKDETSIYTFSWQFAKFFIDPINEDHKLSIGFQVDCNYLKSETFGLSSNEKITDIGIDYHF
ncbi:hypothetical protein H8E88_25500 [candidate division KSB1 bacterium]|nr:hypothetical protein [candidate division KSB1 bacterium]